MNLRIAIFITIISAITLTAACGGAEPVANTSNSNTTKANTTNSDAGNAVATTSKQKEETANNAPTLTQVFKAYCEAMEKKNEAGIRKVYSKDTLEFFDKDMKDEGSKSLVEYLSTDQVTTALCEIRNEVITGDTAVAEVKTAGMPNGEKVVFVKEGTEWKITNRLSLDAVKDTAPNSNTAK